jgi:O-acetyl-ADP-ribose deacetylase
MIDDANYIPTIVQIDAVLAFLPVFEQKGFVPSKVEMPFGKFPYHVFSEELSQFVTVLYDNGFIFTFDWPSWQKEAQHYYKHPKLFHMADIQILRKLFTIHIRKERFCEGHLPAMVSDGHIVAILRRLKELRDELD